MNNILKEKFGRLASFLKRAEPSSDEPLSDGAEGRLNGKLYKAMGFALPLICGLTAGWFGMTCLEVWLNAVNGRGRPFAPESFISASGGETDGNGMEAFLRTNPFRVTPMPAGTTGEERAAAPISGSLAEAVLKGTSPGFVAWMEVQGQLRLVMLGGSFDAYTLEEVTYLDATFVKDGQRVVKEIVYGGGELDSPQQGRPPAGVSAAFPVQAVPPNPGGGSPGVINRDTINMLLENPFDELKKVRIRPAPEGQGLRVEWIVPDSILAQLGVRENDVVQAVNGIVFRNAMDISNSLNSLIASDQFIVDVVRDGQPTTLAYEVR